MTVPRKPDLQAAILRVKLHHLDMWNTRRRMIADLYTDLLSDCEQITTPFKSPNVLHSFNYYTIRCTSRDSLHHYLADHNIQTAIYYPIPLHLQPIYKSLRYSRNSFPNAARASRSVLSLPMYPELSPDHIEHICQHIKRFYSQKPAT